MRSVVAGVLLPVLVVVLIGPYMFLPSLLEYAVAQDVKARVGTEKQPYVELKSDPPLRMQDVDVQKDGVVVRSEVSVLGRRFPASIEGEPGLRGGELIFQPQGLTAAGVQVPDELADRLLAGTSFEYPLDRLPYQTTITSVEAREGQIILSGRVPSVPLGAYPGG